MKNENNWFQKVFLERWHPYAWIILIGFLVYFSTLFFGFTYLDDNVLILDNYRFLNDFSNFFKTFKQEVFHVLHSSAAYYRPILTISFMIDAHLSGISPFGYHFMNVIIHLLASCLLFLFLTKLKYKKGLALFFSLVFTVHPGLNQAVAWVPGRNDSLLAVFVLLAFILFLKFLETKKWKYYLSHLCFFALALLTKEVAIVLPLLVVLYVWLIYKERLPTNYKYKIALGWLTALTIWFSLRQIALSVNPIEMTIFDMGQSIFLNLPAVIQYIGKVIFPFNLSVLPLIQDTTFIYGFVAIVLLITVLIFSRNKRWNFIVFGIFWFFLFLLPSFVRPNPTIVADFIEHRLYLPIIGFIFILPELNLVNNFFLKRKKLLISLGVIVLIIFSGISLTHNNVFKNRISFWKNAAENSPHSPLAHRNLGAMYYLDGFFDKAEPEYRKSLELNPNEQMAHNNLGLIYMNKNMLQEAEIEYKKELEINPFYDNAHFNLGLLYYRKGEFEKAENSWKRTLQINPDHIDACYNLIVYYTEQDKSDQAAYYINYLKARGVNISFSK